MASVEERLAKVEKEIAELKVNSDNQSSKPGLLKKVEGSYKDDPGFLDIASFGKEARDTEEKPD